LCRIDWLHLDAVDSTAVTYVAGLCFGITQIDISPLAFATILCNVASWAALVVFLHSASPMVSALTYLFLNGAGGMGGIFTRIDKLPNEYLEYLKTVCLLSTDGSAIFCRKL